jgi:hypothetical protein
MISLSESFGLVDTLTGSLQTSRWITFGTCAP